ncbi:MAG: hypothetical protein GXO66_07335 [Euryarchaeota archaeon]|nr:hypothetical protein [Euryarchaeota archaeon]
MLERVLGNKYVARVREGDVGEDEIGFARELLEGSELSAMDEVIVYPFGELRPYFLRRRHYVVEVKRRTHYGYTDARRGYALLSPESMERLELKSEDSIILDPVTPKLELGELLDKVRRCLQ